jgi:hypothetical protein
VLNQTKSKNREGEFNVLLAIAVLGRTVSHMAAEGGKLEEFKKGGKWAK